MNLFFMYYFMTKRNPPPKKAQSILRRSTNDLSSHLCHITSCLQIAAYRKCRCMADGAPPLHHRGSPRKHRIIKIICYAIYLPLFYFNNIKNYILWVFFINKRFNFQHDLSIHLQIAMFVGQ